MRSQEQIDFFSAVERLPRGVRKSMDRSWAHYVSRAIFNKINERRYAELYSEVNNRVTFHQIVQ